MRGIMNKIGKTRYENRFNKKPTCFRCQKQITIGELYHSSPSSTKKYCQKCYESMFIEVPDSLKNES